VRRCEWAGGDPVYIAYHDHEWGAPVHDDRKHFEMLTLESFQAGLSWLTILKRRENFFRAFAGWDWNKVAAFSRNDIERLMQDASIIRNRLKITATINNARRFIDVRTEFGSFDRYLWQFTGYKTLRKRRGYRFLKEIPTHSPESDAMSKDLKKRGFSFVGTVICYSLMQAIGMVDDHLEGCFRRGAAIGESLPYKVYEGQR
jgi:DNA-3-methyladenine glycosylase I